MASNFPTSIDNFANPVYTKVDGTDVVQAAHVNDLQDAVRAIEETLITGKTINFNSNNYIADNTSIKLCVETLDDNLGAVDEALAAHKANALVSDPAEHHANIIAIDPIGNLSADRVQPAIYELQGDIDNLLGVGSTSPAASLDSRYVNTSGSDTMQGPLAITEDLVVGKETTLGSATSDAHTWTGEFAITGDIAQVGSFDIDGDVLLSLGSKIAESSDPSASYIKFETDRIEVYSHKDFVVRLDADDATDALANAGEFKVMDGLNAEIMKLTEAGNLNVLSQVSSEILQATSLVEIGDDAVITDNKLDLKSNLLHIQLDKANTQATARLVVTMDGDTAASLSSPDLLLDLDHNATLRTGVHVLKPGIQETGYFGFRGFSPNAGGVFFGVGVNFKHELSSAPSSVTLTVDENINAQNISVTHISKYGFFIECDSLAIGDMKLRGTYHTVGN